MVNLLEYTYLARNPSGLMVESSNIAFEIFKVFSDIQTLMTKLMQYKNHKENNST